MLLHYLAKHGNIRKSLISCITALLGFSQSLLDFFDTVNLELIFTLLYGSLSLVVN